MRRYLQIKGESKMVRVEKLIQTYTLMAGYEGISYLNAAIVREHMDMSDVATKILWT